jgi:hypothetical protein
MRNASCSQVARRKVSVSEKNGIMLTMYLTGGMPGGDLRGGTDHAHTTTSKWLVGKFQFRKLKGITLTTAITGGMPGGVRPRGEGSSRVGIGIHCPSQHRACTGRRGCRRSAPAGAVHTGKRFPIDLLIFLCLYLKLAGHIDIGMERSSMVSSSHLGSPRSFEA